METAETRVLKSSFSGIKGAKKERKMLEKSSQSFLGPGCREFESRHSDHKSRKSICSLGFYLLNARLERSNRNMPVAYCCHQCKHWWLPLFSSLVEREENANESRHLERDISPLGANPPVFATKTGGFDILQYCKLIKLSCSGCSYPLLSPTRLNTDIN